VRAFQIGFTKQIICQIFLTPKGPLSIRGTNEFRPCTYGLNFCYDFLKLFLKIKKLISFMGIQFFSIGAQEQKLCPNKLKTKERGQQKNIIL